MSFDALKNTVEAIVKDEREPSTEQNPDQKVSQRDYSIRYMDNENELINVSDDDDLQTAYELAETDLKGNLKLIVELKKPVEKAVTFALPPRKC